jgi:hypothetical protein
VKLGKTEQLPAKSSGALRTWHGRCLINPKYMTCFFTRQRTYGENTVFAARKSAFREFCRTCLVELCIYSDRKRANFRAPAASKEESEKNSFFLLPSPMGRVSITLNSMPHQAREAKIVEKPAIVMSAMDLQIQS